MCHAKVTRTSTKEGEKLEYLTHNGDWTTDPDKAHNVSEEDANAFIRVLQGHTRDVPAEYTFNYKIFDE